jgi:NADH dehydrogenase (ubiquinone) flavoprotein 2
MMQAFKTLQKPGLRAFSAFANHRNTPDNLESSPFEYSDASWEAIKVLLAKYPDNYKSSAVIPALFVVQKQNNNFLTLSAMNKVAKTLEMTPMQVYEVAAFYTMFNRTKVGKYHLQVCGTTPCMIRGASEVIRAIKDFAHIGEGETSADGLFTMNEVECLGACVNAPMI